MNTTQAPFNLKTLFILGRVSNLPTVWSNVLAAGLLTQTLFISSQPQSQNIELAQWFFLLFGMSLMYIGGMFLNDACDAQWDKENNVKRPITLGKIETNTVYTYSAIALVLGTITLIILSILYTSGIYTFIWITLLLLSIVSYNLWHKTQWWSQFLMGLCRACIYLISALVIAKFHNSLLLVALALGLFISGITLLAQTEHNSPIHLTKSLIYKQYIALALLLITPCALIWILPYNILFAGVCLLFGTLILKTTLPLINNILKNKFTGIQPKTIGTLLALITLFDAAVLASVEQWAASLICLVLYGSLPKLHRWITPT